MCIYSPVTINSPLRSLTLISNPLRCTGFGPYAGSRQRHMSSPSISGSLWLYIHTLPCVFFHMYSMNTHAHPPTCVVSHVQYEHTHAHPPTYVLSHVQYEHTHAHPPTCVLSHVQYEHTHAHPPTCSLTCMNTRMHTCVPSPVCSFKCINTRMHTHINTHTHTHPDLTRVHLSQTEKNRSKVGIEKWTLCQLCSQGWTTGEMDPLLTGVNHWRNGPSAHRGEPLEKWTLTFTRSNAALVSSHTPLWLSSTPALSSSFSFSHTSWRSGRGGGTGLLISPSWTFSVFPLTNLSPSTFEYHCTNHPTPLTCILLLSIALQVPWEVSKTSSTLYWARSLRMAPRWSSLVTSTSTWKPLILLPSYR